MIDRDKEWQRRLREDDPKAMEEVYVRYRSAFFSYASRYGLAQEDLQDIYQDATVAMHQNFVEKQLELKDATIKTYLFGIGKYLIFNRLKSAGKAQVLVDQVSEEEVETVAWEAHTPTAEQQKLSKYFGQLGESCQWVLKMFYYRGFTLSEIVEVSHYKDVNTVKSHKSRCIRRLTELVKKGA